MMDVIEIGLEVGLTLKYRLSWVLKWYVVMQVTIVGSNRSKMVYGMVYGELTLVH